MSKYRKKPVVVEAVQITDEWFDGDHPNPLHPSGFVIDPVKRVVEIETLEGVMTGQVGDFIITGVAGEVYPCKPDIFAATYEAVDATARPAGRGGDRGAAVTSRVTKGGFTAGDVYTVARGVELHQLTSQGWEIHQTIEGTLVETVTETVPNPAYGQTDEGRDRYQSAPEQTISVSKSHVVHEVRFVMRVSADSVLAAKEKELGALLEQLHEARSDAATAALDADVTCNAAAADLLAEKTTHGRAIRDLEISERSRGNYRDIAATARDEANAVKRQLAKVKRALGVDRMKEILDVKTKTKKAQKS